MAEASGKRWSIPEVLLWAVYCFLFMWRVILRLRILGIGVFGLAFLLIFILIIGGEVHLKGKRTLDGAGGYVPSWLRPLLQAVDF